MAPNETHWEAFSEEERIRDLFHSLDKGGFDSEDMGFLNNHTLRRFLVACDWDLSSAAARLRDTLQWRREYKPQHVICHRCRETPGCHSMRQVGFDKDGRPVLYMCFAQCSTTEQTVDGAVQHVIALLENAAKSSDQEICGYVWVLDLQGFKFFSRQKIAVAIEKVVSKHYPELLEALLVVNPGLFFHTVWHAMRRFIDQNTRSKIHLYRDKPRLQEKFHNLFPCELREWLFNEINLNLNSQYPKAQKTFWKYNHGDMHDPRGCASYVQKYVDNITLADYEDSFDRTFHLPHKNVLDEVLLRGKFKACGMKYH